jgi:hypothetical protein
MENVWRPLGRTRAGCLLMVVIMAIGQLVASAAILVMVTPYVVVAFAMSVSQPDWEVLGMPIAMIEAVALELCAAYNDARAHARAYTRVHDVPESDAMAHDARVYARARGSTRGPTDGVYAHAHSSIRR